MKQIRLILLGVVILALFSLYGHFYPEPKPNPVAVGLGVTPKSPINFKDLLSLAPTVSASEITDGSSVSVPILMYHHVGPLLNTDAVASDLTVSIADFESQIQYFKEKGYASVSLAQVYSAVAFQIPLPPKPVVFTFDDGYQDVFENAIPILEKYGFTGTFAIATELLGRPSYAVWDEVLEAQKSGMEIVSHTENHLDLTSDKYSDKDLNREIFGSKQVLEEKLGTSIDFFVYPYGKYNDKVVGLVKAAGYKLALTTAFGLQVHEQTLLTTPRLRVHGQNGLDKIKRVFEPWLFPKPESETEQHSDLAPPSL